MRFELLTLLAVAQLGDEGLAAMRGSPSDLRQLAEGVEPELEIT